jgi:hypothetical protein
VKIQHQQQCIEPFMTNRTVLRGERDSHSREQQRWSFGQLHLLLQNFNLSRGFAGSHCL